MSAMVTFAHALFLAHRLHQLDQRAMIGVEVPRRRRERRHDIRRQASDRAILQAIWRYVGGGAAGDR
jgi:hypothetical protein